MDETDVPLTQWLVLVRHNLINGKKGTWMVCRDKPFDREASAREYIAEIYEDFDHSQFTAVPVPR